MNPEPHSYFRVSSVFLILTSDTRERSPPGLSGRGCYSVRISCGSSHRHPGDTGRIRSRGDNSGAIEKMERLTV